jgi:predicted  nucleic acid-binding Zn-ribbon protein
MRAPARKRVRALTVLARIKDQQIESVTAELRLLQDRIGQLREDRRGLEGRLEANAQTDTLEGSLFIARYARAVREQIAVIDHEISRETPRLDALEARMRDLFTEAKTYESLQGRIRTGELRRQKELEEAALEEMFLMRLTAEERRP